MSDVGFLEKLLNGALVEWKPLEDVTLPTKNIRWAETDRSYRYIDLTSVDRETGVIAEAKEITADTAPSRAQKLVQTDDLIFATTRPAQQRFCLISPEWSGQVASTGYCVLRPDQSQVLPGWLLHWIGSAKFKAYVEEHQTGSAYPAISDARVKAFEIPIPCPDQPERSLRIQKEIVRILSSFTELTAELTAELAARKKQYNHYRDQLLTFEEGEVEWKELGEVFEMRAGQHIKAAEIESKQTETHRYPCFGGNGIRGFVRGKSHEGDYLLIGRQGALCGNVQRAKSPFYATEHAVVVTASAAINVDWAYHYLTFMNLNQYKSQSAQPGLAVGNLLGLTMPVPPIDDQNRVASILDKFDTLTTSLSEGLPREIALRQQQYEYYRDLLLSFPKPDEAAAA